MKLSELLKNVDVISQYTDVEVSDVTDDTQKLQKGMLFVCIIGARFDGHEAAGAMLEKGAVAVLSYLISKWGLSAPCKI